MLLLIIMKNIFIIIILSLYLGSCVSTNYPDNEVRTDEVVRTDEIVKTGMKMSNLYQLIQSQEKTIWVLNNDTDPRFVFFTTSYFSNSKIYFGIATDVVDHAGDRITKKFIEKDLEKYELIKIYPKAIDGFDKMISLEKDLDLIFLLQVMKSNQIVIK